jgi:hypothetical protein
MLSIHNTITNASRILSFCDADKILDITKFKVEALAEVLKKLADVEVVAHIERYTNQP